MRIALVSLKTKPKLPIENLRYLETILLSVENAHPDLVVLPECTLTGYMYHEEDLNRFGESIHGQTVTAFSQLAQKYQTFICFGMLELDESQIYDTGVLLDREGQIVLLQRKLSESLPFKPGERVVTAQTEFGKIAMLICGDLFNSVAITQLPDDTNLILAPLARSFSVKSPDTQRWESEERSEYLQAIKSIGHTTILVNALDEGIEEPSFGGALIVNGNGEIITEAPHGSHGVLLYDL